MSATLVSLWTEVRRRLEAAGVETPVLDARMLVEAGAGVSRLDIVTDPRRLLSSAQIASVDALAARRVAREPMAYILGRKAFWSIELAITADVLTPRPETELLVETALSLLPADQPARVLDLGVGSGAILLAVLLERPLAHGVGVDLSASALAVASANARALAMEERVVMRQGGWEGEYGRFDFVLSNPPYIRSGEFDALAPELHYEPRLALDGGEGGLDAYRAIVARLPALLVPGAAFAFEVGQGQADAVAGLAQAHGLTVAAHRTDLAGVQRVVSGRAPG